MSPPPPSIPLPHTLLQAEQDAHLVQQRTAQRRKEMKRSVLRTLTMTQNTSAMVFSVFMVAHLASPVVAVFGGLSGADKTMMIARDLYLPLEPVLVYAPLTIHLFSSLARRLITMSSAFSTTSSSPTSDTNSDPESASDKPMTTSTSKLFRTLLHSIRLRLPRQAHQILAYPLTLLLTSHVLTHRLIPQSSQPPISSLSPSELGWDFVGYNLQSAVSWLAYLGLVGAGVWHAAVGSMKVVSWLKSGRRARGRDTGVRGASVGTEEIASGEKEVVSSSTQETPAPAANGKGKTTASPIGNLPKPSEPTTSPPLNPTPSPKRPVVSRRRKFGLRSIIALFLGLISVGLYRVRSDTASYGISALMKRRYDAVFAAVPWAVLWLH